MKRIYLNSHLSKMHTRRMPGVNRKGWAAYKTDGEKSPELEMLEKKVTQHDSELQNLFAYLREFLEAKPTPVKIGFKRKNED